MPNIVEVVAHFRPVRGESQSHLVAGADRNLYIAKFSDNPQHPRLPANEWLAGYIANLLHLPVPQRAILHFTHEFMASAPQLGYVRQGVTIPYRAGYHYGSRLVGGLLPSRAGIEYLPVSELERVANLQDFIGALVMDKWIDNADARQAVFISRDKGRTYQAHFIDSGSCFNAEHWKLKDHPLRGLYGRRQVYASAIGLCTFEPWIERIKKVCPHDMWKVLSSLPESWRTYTGLEAAQLIDRLTRRVPTVERRLQDLRSSHSEIFPAWA